MQPAHHNVDDEQRLGSLLVTGLCGTGSLPADFALVPLDVRNWFRRCCVPTAYASRIPPSMPPGRGPLPVRWFSSARLGCSGRIRVLRDVSGWGTSAMRLRLAARTLETPSPRFPAQLPHMSEGGSESGRGGVTGPSCRATARNSCISHNPETRTASHLLCVTLDEDRGGGSMPQATRGGAHDAHLAQ